MEASRLITLQAEPEGGPAVQSSQVALFFSCY